MASASDLTKTALQLSATRFCFLFVRHLYGDRFLSTYLDECDATAFEH